MTLKLPPTRLTLGQTGKGSYFGISRKEVVCECLSQFSRISLPPCPFCTFPSALGSVGMIDEPCCGTPPPAMGTDVLGSSCTLQPTPVA